MNSNHQRSKMKKSSYIAVFAVFALLLVGPEITNAVTCSALQLAPCLNAFISSNPPTTVCCDKLREQRPCLCQYLRDPNLKGYVNGPNAKKVASKCGVSTPNC
ncbi:hypothetical protein GIB67_028891 [Kingdonia uniflora]|uniref:Bifunctional inhibitor/plant lipid transfer protein/seed storage helical domain-containing protein n=1 Tax=Kingdonia uniflora TaxID=39325 RepID=A0A7J7LT98_9MAGN|nr:hypothetical protein GIB67_028891 [Kingdonia uniflora]